MRALALALVLVAPATAAAGREITVGASLGKSRSEQAVSADQDTLGTLGLWGRVRLTPRLSAQLELVRHDPACSSCPDTSALRTTSALLVVELADKARWMPVLYVGGGLDRDGQGGELRTEGHHLEGGLGVEYRADGGFVLGLDARLGGRTIDSRPDVVFADQPGIAIVPLAPSGLQPGEYRALRLTVGFRFQ